MNLLKSSIVYTMEYKNGTPIRIFLDEISEHVTTLLQQNYDPIILGDINIPWNKDDNIAKKKPT